MIATGSRSQPRPGGGIASRAAAGRALAGCDVAVHVTRAAAGDGCLPAVARELGEQLAADRLALPRSVVRIAAVEPSGRPTILVHGRPAPTGISLSHIDGLVAAACGESGGLGIDLVDPAEAGRGLDFWFTPDELALEPDEGLLRARLWAAKEAAYKAAGIDEELRPRTVTIESLSPGRFAWTARGRYAAAAGGGRFITAGRHVVAVAASTPEPFTLEVAFA
jgi:hypothetical protein